MFCLCALFRDKQIGIFLIENWGLFNLFLLSTNVYGAQESIPKNRFRQPTRPDGGLSYRPALLGIDSWIP